MNSRLAWVTDTLSQIKPTNQRKKKTKQKTLKSVRPRLCVIAKSSSSIFMFVCGVTICICMVLHVWGHTCVCMYTVNVHVCACGGLRLINHLLFFYVIN